jgi:signal transduction histidine kinase/DNA-binding response OmpR family regulator
MMTRPLLTIRIASEFDVVQARQRARDIAAMLAFDRVAQTRLATAVSELTRNALAYAGGGRVDFQLEGVTAPQLLVMTIADSGKGIADLDDILGGRFVSPTGMGRGISGSRRLVDGFEITTGPRGTTIILKQLLPREAPFIDPPALLRLVEALSQLRPAGPAAEVQRQNQELLETLAELRSRQEELERVNRELEDTNRGVVALYAELDERADHLRRADELKTRFLSNMTHEFRTPVNSILSLTDLLAERLGIGEHEQNEVFYIRKSAQQLAEIVDDLLDLAKVEAGKVDLRPSLFEVEQLFGALRGMLRPMLANRSLSLVFEETGDLPPIRTDESKLSQILRNFISNALKYTERGEVRVSARVAADRRSIQFAVADTGIGIPEADIGRIFEEFVQIENPLQRRVKGTGLGLPLSRRLAELLGGSVTVESRLGLGSTFTLTLPLEYRRPEVPVDLVPGKVPVLVIEDSAADRLLYERMLARSRYQVVAATSPAEAHAIIELVLPAAIVFDLNLQGEDCWNLLASFKRDPATADVPVIVVSATQDERKGFALGAADYAVKPLSSGWLRAALDRALGAGVSRVLVIDDEDTARFIVRGFLDGGRFLLDEAATAADGLEKARLRRPDAILLDLNLGASSGVTLRQALRADPLTAAIPVVVLTAQTPSDELMHVLGRDTPVLSKAGLTRERLTLAVESMCGVSAGRT